MSNVDPISLDREEGPSWARPNWPVAELDAVNLGLDPTEATLEQVGKTAQKDGDRGRRPIPTLSAARPTIRSAR
jgi:2-oxoglutarate dehydrogenase E1 component